MSSQAVSALLLTATAFSLAIGTPAVAQVETTAGQEEPSGRAWNVAVWVKAGYQLPAGRLANHSVSDNPDLRLLETVSELNNSGLAGGGIEVSLPLHDFSLRLGWESTRGAEATGRIAICDLLEGRLCKPEVAPVAVQAVTSRLRIAGGNAESSIRPVIFLGVEVRQFDFTVSECPSLVDDEATVVCRAIIDLYADPAAHPFLRGGIGVQATVGRLALELTGSAGAGSFKGGGARVDSNWYQELRAEVSMSALIL